MPVATVVLPTHDHGPLLRLSLGTVQEQTVEDIEIFVIGDGVPDETRELVAEIARGDPRIRFFDNPKGPRNGEIHRAAALAGARGEIVCYQSDDDLWCPDQVAELRDLLSVRGLRAHRRAVGRARRVGHPVARGARAGRAPGVHAARVELPAAQRRRPYPGGLQGPPVRVADDAAADLDRPLHVAAVPGTARAALRERIPPGCLQLPLARPPCLEHPRPPERARALARVPGEPGLARAGAGRQPEVRGGDYAPAEAAAGARAARGQRPVEPDRREGSSPPRVGAVGARDPVADPLAREPSSRRAAPDPPADGFRHPASSCTVL